MAAQRASVSGSLVGRLAFIGKSVRGRLTVSFHSGMGIARFYNEWMIGFRSAVSIRAVLFDVDFTLIHPGPTFQGEGYAAFCARHGIGVDASRFGEAVIAAGQLLDAP